MKLDHIQLFWQLVVSKIEEISALSTVEYIRIVGHYQFLVTGKGDNQSELSDRGYSPEIMAEVFRATQETFSPVVSLGLKFTRPLNNYQSDILGYSLVLFENYERGNLPFPGSVSEQPAQIMEIFALLQSLRSEQEEKHRRKLERDVRHQRQSNPRAR